MATRAFTGRRIAPELADRLPPGQRLTEDFPVISLGDYISKRSALGERWTWAEFNTLPQTKMTPDMFWPDCK
jgi:hypothetical protein